MTCDAQKQIERIHFEGFRQASDEFSPGKIVDGRENPDFQVVSGGRVVGIEHTRVFKEEGQRDQPLQARETRECRIAKEAQSDYESRDNPPVWVGLYYDSNATLDDRRYHEVGEEIAQVVENTSPDQHSSTFLRDADREDPELPPEVDTIRVIRQDESRESYFFSQSSRFGWHPEVPVSNVRDAFDRKEGHVTGYRRAEEYERTCDEVWLLIVIDGRLCSSFLDAAGDAISATYESSFDRAFLFQFADGQVRELSIVDRRQ